MREYIKIKDPEVMTSFLSIEIVDFAVPKWNDLYIDKTGKLMRCKALNYSNRARKRFIVKELFDLTTIEGRGGGS